MAFIAVAAFLKIIERIVFVQSKEYFMHLHKKFDFKHFFVSLKNWTEGSFKRPLAAHCQDVDCL